jgi:hypothetical protein
MDAEITGGNSADTNREVQAKSGWVTTKQAARSLGISPRTVRWHIEQGNLLAEPQGEGVQRTWLVSIDSLHAFRDERQDATHSPRHDRTIYEGAETTADITEKPIRVLADRLAEEAARAAEYRVRLELTEQAQSTLEEALAKERQSREKAERERDEFRRQLQALEASQEPRESPVTASEGRGDGEEKTPRGDKEEPQEPWWRRWFGL